MLGDGLDVALDHRPDAGPPQPEDEADRMIEALGVAKPLARHRCAGPSAAEQGEADAERRAGRDLHVAAREQGRAACALLLVGGQNEFHLAAGELKTPEQEMRQPR